MTNHPNRSRSLEQWCDSRSTSEEIGAAIHEIAADRAEANRIWEEPTAEETAKVLAIAWANTEDDELFWGCETYKRAA